MALWQVVSEAGPGPGWPGPTGTTAGPVTIDGLLGGTPGALAAALAGPSAGPVPTGAQVVAPVVWAAGVT
jgi:hypothetical protein